MGFWRSFIIAGIIVFALYLIFANLGSRALWEDEAQNALLARQVLKYGLPFFPEGDNMPTDRPDYTDFNKDRVFTWNTWLPFYITAASFKVFGESEWSARLPFAFIGFLTVLLYTRTCLTLFGQNRRIVIVAILLLVFSVPFILHMRQSRYYALATFGTLWMIWGFLSSVKGEKGGWLHIASASLLCFYSFPIVAVLNLAAFWLYGVVAGKGRAFYSSLALSSGIIFMFAIPAILYMQIWKHFSNETKTPFSIARSFWIYLLWINGFIMPFLLPVAGSFIQKSAGRYLLLLSYVFFLAGSAIIGPSAQVAFVLALTLILCMLLLRLRNSGSLRNYITGSQDPVLREFFGVFCVMAVLYLSAMSFMSPYAFLRYLLPLMPPAFIVSAFWTDKYFLKGGIIGYSVVAVLISSNFLSSLPLKAVQSLTKQDEGVRQEYTVFPRELWRWSKLRLDIIDYLYEITHGISDPEKVLVDYFKKNGKKGQVVKTSYDDITLMYYVPYLRIIPRWDPGDDTPDYIIARGPYPLIRDVHQQAYTTDNSRVTVTLPAPDIVWCNNPDPLFHRYRLPRTYKPIVVYTRQPR